MIELVPPAPQRRGALRDFGQAAEAALEFLHDAVGLDVWLVTRRSGDALQVGAVAGEGVRAGTTLRWDDSVCARMARGEGPRCAPALRDVPAYALAPVRGLLGVEAYLGAPLVDENGDVVGSVCGLSRNEQPDLLGVRLPLVEHVAVLLGALLHQQAEAERWRGQAAEADLRAERDALTGLANRRGWQRAMRVEEDRSDRSATPAAVLAVDLDGFKDVNDRLGHHAGDEHLRATARALTAACRPEDVVARVGGDEFTVLAGGCDPLQVCALQTRVERRLAEQGVAATVGSASRSGDEALRTTWQRADAALYAAKPQPRHGHGPWPRRLEDPAPAAPGPLAVLRARRQLVAALHLAGLEPQELVRLQLSDVVLHPSGLFVTVPPLRAGDPPRRATVRRQDGEACPLRAFEVWCDALERAHRDRRGRSMQPADRGMHPLLCAVSRDGRPSLTRSSAASVGRILGGERRADVSS